MGKPKVAGQDVFERINFLFQSAYAVVTSSPKVQKKRINVIYYINISPFFTEHKFSKVLLRYTATNSQTSGLKN